MSLLYPGASAATVQRWIFLMAEASRKATEWAAVQDYRDYYAGSHPVMLTHRQEEYLGPLLTKTGHTVAHNLCGVIVDVLRERLVVEGFTGKDPAGEALASLAWEWWETGRMGEKQITAMRRALRDGAGYLIVDWDAENECPTWVPNRKYDGQTGVTFHRDPETDKPAMAIKYWRVDDPLSSEYGRERRTVYLPDAILRQRADPGATDGYGWGPIDASEGKAYQPWTSTMTAGGEPLGVACIEFLNPGGVSEIESVIGLQNALNKTWIDALAAADAHGFPVLTVNYTGPMTAAGTDDEDSTDEDLQIAPGRVLELFDGATADRIAAGDLTPLLDLIDRLTGAIAGVSRTPQYYLRPFGGADVPSGEALKQLESALVSRAKERFVTFGGAWVDAVRLAARYFRAMGRGGVDPRGKITTNWGTPEVRNELYDTQVATAEQGLGIPVEVLWERRLNYSPDDVKLFKQMRAREQASQLANVMQGLMANASNRAGGAAGAGSNGQPGQPGGGPVSNGGSGQPGARPANGGNGTAND